MTICQNFASHHKIIQNFGTMYCKRVASEPIASILYPAVFVVTAQKTAIFWATGSFPARPDRNNGKETRSRHSYVVASKMGIDISGSRSFYGRNNDETASRRASKFPRFKLASANAPSRPFAMNRRILDSRQRSLGHCRTVFCTLESPAQLLERLILPSPLRWMQTLVGVLTVGHIGNDAR